MTITILALFYFFQLNQEKDFVFFIILTFGVGQHIAMESSMSITPNAGAFVSRAREYSCAHALGLTSAL